MQNAAAKKHDFNIYPSDSLEGKGILPLMNTRENNQSSVYRNTCWVSKKGYAPELFVDNSLDEHSLLFDRLNPGGQHAILP